MKSINQSIGQSFMMIRMSFARLKEIKFFSRQCAWIPGLVDPNAALNSVGYVTSVIRTFHPVRILTRIQELKLTTIRHHASTIPKVEDTGNPFDICLVILYWAGKKCRPPRSSQLWVLSAHSNYILRWSTTNILSRRHGRYLGDGCWLYLLC
jgi:hypothetical protein